MHSGIRDDHASVHLLRHLVATITYRADVATSDVPEGFARTRLAVDVRTPLELLAHVADLMQWSAALVRGAERPAGVEDASWDAALERLEVGLEQLDLALANGPTPSLDVEALLQGPLADALTHVGQLLLVRRLAGVPAPPQGYYRAEIEAGRPRRDAYPRSSAT